MDPFGIISLNCHGGINRTKKLEQIIYYLNSHDWQVAMLQETSFLKEKTREKMTLGLGSFVIQHPNTPQRPGGGVVTLVKDSFRNNIVDFSFFAGYRGILLNLCINEEVYTICNIYANVKYNEKRADFISLGNAIANKKNVIIGGDLNGVTATSQRVTPSDQNKVDDVITNFIKEKNLKDLPVTMESNDVTYIGKTTAAMLDRFLSSPSIKIYSYFVTICPFSDHSSVHISLFNSLTTNSRWRPKSTWKLNLSLLDDPNIIKGLKVVWDEWNLSKPYFLNIGDWWERGKAKIKKFLITKGIAKARERKVEKMELEKQIKNKLSNNNTNELLALKQRLREIEEYKMEGAKIRSRKLLLPSEERGSSDFFAIEGKCRKTERINSLMIEGKESFQEDKIKKSIHDFYSKLYKSEGVDKDAINSLLDNIQPLELTKVQNEVLNDFFSEAELKKALWKMKNQDSRW